MKKFLCEIVIFTILISVLFYVFAPIVNATNNITNTDITDVEDTKKAINNTTDNKDNKVEKKLMINSTNTDILKESITNNTIEEKENDNDNILEESTNGINTTEKVKSSNINMQNTIDQILISNENFATLNSNSIYIQNDISNDILKILNFNSIYTYSINDKGILQCDNIKKVNDFIDTENETEVDIIIKNISENTKQKIIIMRDDIYLDNLLLPTNIYENEDYKFIILNPSFFREDLVNEFHPSLSDYILKGISYDQYGVSPLSSFATTGKSTSTQTVYFGPSTSNYAEIGSVNWLETVQIIGINKEWYHITYEIGSTGTYKTGYVPKSNVSNASGPDLYEEQLVGGYRVANRLLDVRSYDVYNQSISIGTVYNTEGVTCLYSYTNSSGNAVSYIEFSTSKGTKRGYIDTSYLTEPINYFENGHHYDTTVGYIKYDVNLSMGVGNGYVNTGLALSKDEYVAVLGKENNNLYVEYNTKTGRKRAFMTTDNIELTRHYTNGALNWYPDLPTLYGQKVSNIAQTVYGTPSTEGATIGSIDAGEAVYVYMNHKFNDINNTYSYIAYNTANGKKTGYVPTNTLSNFTQVNLPEFKDFEGAEKTIVSSAGDVNGNNKTDMAFYKVGTGQNKLYLVFNQHGWEDAYPGDGVELVRIAQSFLKELTDSTHSDILEKWTVVVVCDANPNGILNGADHQGIGRTVPYSGVDMNRAWPTNNWVPSSVTTKGKKLYTGTNPVDSCLELKQVKTFLESNSPNSGYTSIFIDIHGWDCETIGDEKIGNYYNTASTFSSTSSGIDFFSKLYGNRFRNRAEFGQGYLATWAKQKLGTNYAIILELPYPQNSTTLATADNNTVQSNNYAGRFITGTLNILNNEAIE